MNKEARKVNVIYEELRGRLTYPLLLYVPKNYFENLLQNEQLIQLDWVFDVLIMVKHELDVVFIDDKDESHEVLKKQGVLEENLFDLVDYQIALKPAQFSFLIKKYKDYLFVIHYMAELMMNDVNLGVDERYKKYSGHFILQENALDLHKRSIDDAFPYFKKIQAEEGDMRANIIDNFKLPIIERGQVDVPKQKPKRKKEKIITDLESQNFLLENVFKVKK